MEVEYKKAVNLYLSGNYNTQELYESTDHPMHPNFFFQLSKVRNFNELNGYTYAEYLEKWKERCQQNIKNTSQ